MGNRCFPIQRVHASRSEPVHGQDFQIAAKAIAQKANGVGKGEHLALLAIARRSFK